MKDQNIRGLLDEKGFKSSQQEITMIDILAMTLDVDVVNAFDWQKQFSATLDAASAQSKR